MGKSESFKGVLTDLRLYRTKTETAENMAMLKSGPTRRQYLGGTLMIQTAG